MVSNLKQGGRKSNTEVFTMEAHTLVLHCYLDDKGQQLWDAQLVNFDNKTNAATCAAPNREVAVHRVFDELARKVLSRYFKD